MHNHENLHYKIIVYGCQMNEHDAELLRGQLEDLGYSAISEEEKADLVILLTCAVRDHAEQRVYGKIGQLYRLKLENPRVLLAVGGCIPQQSQVAEKMKQRFPYLDVIFGTHNLAEFSKMLKEAQARHRTVAQVWEEAAEISEGLSRRRQDGLKAWTMIMYGCDNYCSYCIVPYVRGRERSRLLADVVGEVEALAKAGYREVTLLGQNVNSYGQDLALGYDFADLLRAVDATGIDRIRFMTSHPKDTGPRLVRAMAECDHVMEHLHLPVQAGSNQILKAMNRRYSREDYLGKIAELRSAVPDIALTTDIIVGFPGETEDDFEATMNLVEEVRYDAAFTFIYSPRSGTPAATMSEQVPAEVAKERLLRLNALQNRISKERNRELVGTWQEVLVEGPSKSDPNKLTGRTRGNKLVHFNGPQELAGQIVEVRIAKAQTWNLRGHPWTEQGDI